MSATSVFLDNMLEEIASKNQRYPNIPAVRIGRLAITSNKQGQHIGSLMVLDASRRSCINELAWALFLMDAKNERVAAFYEKFLFQPFANKALHLWMHRKQTKALYTIEAKSK